MPHLAGLVSVDAVERSPGVIRIVARARAAEGLCPRCGTASRRVHGHYERNLGDTAVGASAVVIRLRIRRFLCRKPECETVTFAEQIPGLTTPHARFSPVRLGAMRAIARALAGRAGARPAMLLGIPVNRMTLLRLLRKLPEPLLTAAPSVLGVDDFALKRGHVYGTVLLDMDSHRPVDLLPGRTAATFAAWLLEHPGTTVICRDRAGSYADGARTGAPNALQVADRFHLWHNLADVVDKSVRAHRVCLLSAPPPDRVAEDESPRPVESRTGFHDVTGQERLVTRLVERHAAVHGLLAEGESLNGISRRLDLTFRTVRRAALAHTADELVASIALLPSKLDEYKPYLTRRWNEGCRSAARLHEEIRSDGWNGSSRTVHRYVRILRGQTVVTPAPTPPPKPRRLAAWIMSHPDYLDADDAIRLKTVLDRCPELLELAAHVRDFAKMMTNLEGHRLDAWIASATAEHRLPELCSFARGLRHDHAAVTAGLTLSHSSGAVEGTVNKIKMLKRQMFGRANFDLLRIRVLHAL